ncbi:hypothetical protein KY338_01880 [Candidatus Woesearchaeota archaeon]|nr:hypothetical protein [Candidatus Woesearchaeota archaeon]MBW3005974.1 hypothetical protein [Candidatus Woesearchaeota archaeon]
MTPEEKKARLAQIAKSIDKIHERLEQIPSEKVRLDDARREVRKKGLQKLGQAQEQIKEGKNHAMIKESAEQSEKIGAELAEIGRHSKQLEEEEIKLQAELAVLETERKKLISS